MTVPALVAIVGPTAVGKTELSLRLAERFEGEIVSADSRLLYRGMDIGTAKPSAEARRRVPHHLIDVTEPSTSWSLADFRRAALAVIAEVQARRRLPFLVGGTGQYVTAILEGWTPPPRPVDSTLRHELEEFARDHGAAELHHRLGAVDPASAAAIDPRNVRRVIRALEIASITGMRPSEVRHRSPLAFPVLKIGLRMPRKDLYARLDARTDAMLASGWVDEVRRLLETGVGSASPAMSAIGYRTLAEYLDGGVSLEQAVAEIRRANRAFVRRQANWFKASDASIWWFDSHPEAEAEIEEAIRGWMAGLA